MDRTKILDRIRKLQALSDSPNEAEALAAARRVDKLIREHAVQLCELSAASLNEADPMGVIRIESGFGQHNDQLTWAVARYCNCYALRHARKGHPTTFSVYGRRSDREAFHWLISVARRSSETEYRAWEEAEQPVGRRPRTDWKKGYAFGLAAKLDSLKREADGEDAGAALVLRGRKDEAESFGREANAGRIRQVRQTGRATKASQDGYARGREFAPSRGGISGSRGSLEG